jgi:hypothetical protein
LFCFVFLMVLEFELKLKASCLLGRHTITQATLPALFCVGCFQYRISVDVCIVHLIYSVI